MNENPLPITEISFATTKFPRRQDGRTTGGRSLVRMPLPFPADKQWPVLLRPRARILPANPPPWIRQAPLFCKRWEDSSSAREIPRSSGLASGQAFCKSCWEERPDAEKRANIWGMTFCASASDIAAARRSSSKKWAARKSARSGTWPRNFPASAQNASSGTCRRACWPKQAATAFISAGIAAYCSVRSAWLPPVWTENRHRP